MIIANAPPLKFTQEDADDAFEAWGCNHGPAALAACLCLTLDEVRPFLSDFEEKKYMSPTMMAESLRRIGAPREVLAEKRFGVGEAPKCFPRHGLVRVQFDGPWMARDQHARWSYEHTHWIHTRAFQRRWWVYDVNGAWRQFGDWESITIPLLLSGDPKRTGWFASHCWAVQS